MLVLAFLKVAAKDIVVLAFQKVGVRILGELLEDIMRAPISPLLENNNSIKLSIFYAGLQMFIYPDK